MTRPIGRGFDYDYRAKPPISNTFMCKCCGKGRQILGRRKIGNDWHCKDCVTENKEEK